MKFSLEWLKYFLETEAIGRRIAAALNRIGLEVEGIEDPAERLAGFQVAEVLTARAASRCRQAAGADGRARARASRCRSCAARPMRARA